MFDSVRVWAVVLSELATGELTAETRFGITELGLQALEEAEGERETNRGPAETRVRHTNRAPSDNVA